MSDLSALASDVKTDRPKRRPHAYQVTRAVFPRDREEVLDVAGRNLAQRDQAALQRKFDWYYQENPLGPGRCWVLRTQKDGRAVGIAGLGLRRIWVDGAAVLVGHASDFAVDKEHRSLNPAVLLQKALLASLKEDLPLLYCMPTENAFAAMRMAGYRSLPRLERHVKVLRSRRYLSRVPRLARAGLATMVDWAAQLRSSETWDSAKGYTLNEVSAPDRRFEDLWNRARLRFGMIGDRSPEFLQWRYFDCPTVRYRVLALHAPRNHQLVGWIVCSISELGQCQLVDALVDEPWIGHLFAAFVRWARAAGADSAVVVSAGAEHWRRTLKRFGFRLRPQPPILAAATGAGAFAQEIPADWYFLPGDKDFN